MSQVKTGLEPEASVALSGHEHEGLQQSQYLVVVPDPEACAADCWMKKGRRATRVARGRIIVMIGFVGGSNGIGGVFRGGKKTKILNDLRKKTVCYCITIDSQ